jgi:hypothetical protein
MLAQVIVHSAFDGKGPSSHASGVTPDPAEAARWLQVLDNDVFPYVADSHPLSERMRLGELQNQEKFDEALPLIRKFVERGEPQAMALLVVYHQKELAGLKNDPVVMFKLAQRGAAKGDLTCRILLAGFYAQGMCIACERSCMRLRVCVVLQVKAWPRIRPKPLRSSKGWLSLIRKSRIRACSCPSLTPCKTLRVCDYASFFGLMLCVAVVVDCSGVGCEIDLKAALEHARVAEALGSEKGVLLVKQINAMMAEDEADRATALQIIENWKKAQADSKDAPAAADAKAEQSK